MFPEPDPPAAAAAARWDVIDVYPRSQALADGVLVDVSEMAREAGFRWPVAVTDHVWHDCCEWPTDPPYSQIQSTSGRLWDVLWMTHVAAAASRDSGRIDVQLYVVPLDPKPRPAQLTRLVAVCGPGDQAEPVVTIMFPSDD
jgi:hypothetical protein